MQIVFYNYQKFYFSSNNSDHCAQSFRYKTKAAKQNSKENKNIVPFLKFFLLLVFLSPFSLILVPPEIEPFSFGDLSIRTQSGTRTRVICGLSRGDLPVAFHWLKDGTPIQQQNQLFFVARDEPPTSEPTRLELAISSVDLFSSLLTISRLKPEHTGNYTCVAANPAGSSSYTAPLRVKGEANCRAGTAQKPGSYPENV